MIFLLKFREEILSVSTLSKDIKSKFFVEFAQQVRQPFKDPETIVDIILGHKDQLI